MVRCNLIRIKGKIRERGYHLKYRTEVTVCIRNAETLWAFFQLGLRMQADWMLTSREEFGRLLPGNCTSPNLKRADHLLHSQPLKNWWLQVTAYYFSQFCEIVLLPLARGQGWMEACEVSTGSSTGSCWQEASFPLPVGLPMWWPGLPPITEFPSSVSRGSR